MAPFAVLFGALLIALGAWGYLGADEASRSGTALIPAYLGIALLLLGLIAFKENCRKHAMHAAAALGLLGFLGAAVRVGMKLAKDGNLEGRAAMATGGMAVLCAIFVGLCINSFVAARRARQQTNPPQS
jgi:hypothetical protein